MNKYEAMKTGRFYREAVFDKETHIPENRTIELSFSSEAPVERYFGYEILSHDPSAVRLGRLNSGGPLLLGHDTDNQVGVVEKAYIGDDRRGRALVRFSRSQFAEEIYQDVLDDIRRNVSVGYVIHRMVEEEHESDQLPYFRAMDWEPLEVSLVPIPADNSVGVGRSQDDITTIVETLERRNEPMEETVKIEQEVKAPIINIDDVREKARKDEQLRVKEIMSIGDKHSMRELALEFVNSGKPLDAFRVAVLEKIGAIEKVDEKSSELGMSSKEKRAYSVVRAINAAVTGDWSDAGLEREASRAIADKMGKKPQGFFVPFDVMAKRDLTKGTGSAGGYTVATDLLAGEFIDALRNRMMVQRLGARFLNGLQGDVAIPKMSAGATAYWVAENAAPTESQQTFAQVTLSPKTVGAFTDLSRRLLVQSALSVDELVKTDLQTVLAIALDLAALTGPGTGNAPTGITATSGIGSVAGGTNGLAPAWSHMVALESAVATANADFGSLAYIGSAKVRGKLKQTQKVATYGNDFIWGDGTEPGFGFINGYRAAVSNQMPDNLTKGTSTGVCSAIIFGNFNDLLVGIWGPGIDVLVDPYTGSSAGTVRVRALLDCDIAVRNAASFAAMLDALCA